MMQESDMEAEPNPSQSDLSMTSVDVQRAASSPEFDMSELCCFLTDDDIDTVVCLPLLVVVKMACHNMSFFHYSIIKCLCYEMKTHWFSIYCHFI